MPPLREALPPASALRRFGAYLADSVMLFVACLPLFALLTPLFGHSGVSFCCLVAELLYFTFMTAGGRGATFGGRLFGLRVVRVKGGGSPGPDRAFWRMGSQLLLQAGLRLLPLQFPLSEEAVEATTDEGVASLAALAGTLALAAWYLPAAFGRDRMAFHDKLTGTRVVAEPEGARLF